MNTSNYTDGSMVNKCPEPEQIRDNWRNRKDRMICARCIWYSSKSFNESGRVQLTPIGRCRRHAPCQAVIGWPTVYDSDWCGDFKLDETKA